MSDSLSPQNSAGDSSQRSGKSASAFRTISEVAKELDLPQHVLRFWETKFPNVKPMKRGGGRRYYRPEDIVLLTRIRDLLYDDGYTIKGVQKLLKEHGVKGLLDDQGGATPEPTIQSSIQVTGESEEASGITPAQRQELTKILGELKDIRMLLDDA